MRKIAVLMALYRGDDAVLFERALVSVIDQVIPEPFTLNIYLGVDGPVTPELESVIEKYRSQLFCVSRSESNVGLAVTLNKLISLRGDEDYFFRMDADDQSLPGRFNAQLVYLENNSSVDILGTAIWESCSDGARRIVRFASSPEEARQSICWRVPVAHATVCMRKQVLDRVGCYPDRRGNEDIALWFKCLEVGFQFGNLPDAWYDVTITDSFWNRRSFEKAFTEFRSYVEGLWRLEGFTWRYVFPLARLLLRLSPQWVSRRAYASRFRS